MDNDNNILLNEETTFVFNENEGVNGVYRNADGDRGSAVWGERSPWVALSAEKEDEVITIAICRGSCETG